MNDRLEKLGAEVARIQDDALADRRRHAAARARLLATAEARSRREPTRGGRPALAAATVGVAAVLLVVFWPATPSSIAYRVGQGSESREIGRPIAAPDDQALPLRFTDGASVRLASGSRAQIAELSADGAILRLDRGEAVVFVKHRRSTQWSLQAGPFFVRVTGTRFRVGWAPQERAFELDVYEGEVRVRGPTGPERVVRGGGDLRVSLEPPPSVPIPRAPDAASSDPATDSPPSREPSSSPRPARAPPRPRTSARPEVVAPRPTPPTVGAPSIERTKPGPRRTFERATPPAPPLELDLPPKHPQPKTNAPTSVLRPEETEETPAPPPKPRKAAAETTEQPAREAPPEKPAWRALFERGRHADALTELPAQAIEEALWQSDSTNLLELGAAARRANDHRAGYIYSVIRSRFPRSDAAADAAFMLARMHFHSASPQMAATWLETYLRERPDGRFARAASGRIIEVYEQADDEDRARAAAERYLERYPQGPHADLARAVLE